MPSEHNPIAELVHQIQKKWADEVSPYPKLKLVRWLIKPEEARLYEGFLKLESTEHGAIPEVLIAMLTPFKDRETFSLTIMEDWNKAYEEDAKTREKLKAKGKLTNWSRQTFSGKNSISNVNYDRQLLGMLSSFREQTIEKSTSLVVALFPHSIHSMEGYNHWLTSLVKLEIPEKIAFMIFDHIGQNYFDRVFEKFPEVTKSLHINLDLDGAVSKIAKMGDPNSPEVKFRECILEMGQSLQKNDQPRLHAWGEKALQATQRSGLKSLFASAHIVYAGMLFTFKQFDKIDSLLIKGLSIAKQGLKSEDAACRPLIIQYCGYIASSKQLQKKMKEAIAAFEKQGDLAVEYQLPGMALTPYRQAYTLSKKNLPERYDELIHKAFSTGKSLPAEERLNSSFVSIGLDYVQWQEAKKNWEEAVRTDKELKEIFGADWKEQAKNPAASYGKNTKDLTPVN